MRKPKRPYLLKVSSSKVLAEGRTIIPDDVRRWLRITPGDMLRYRITSAGVLLDKAPNVSAGGPFAVFSEWIGEADERAFAKL